MTKVSASLEDFCVCLGLLYKQSCNYFVKSLAGSSSSSAPSTLPPNLNSKSKHKVMGNRLCYTDLGGGGGGILRRRRGRQTANPSLISILPISELGILSLV